ncbi:MAG: SUMF1/EgtB/PvdO family nonheme iron enzyme [Candidatus Binatia bacterium]
MNIRWLERMEHGLDEGRKRQRAVILLPVGQGMDNTDTWCAAASFTRANMSHPDLVRLIDQAFVPVRFSMHLRGPAVDDMAREFVMKQPGSGPFDTYPPDIFVVSPEAEVLQRFPFDSSTDEIFTALRTVLDRRPDLAPEGAPVSSQPTDPAEIALRAMEARYNRNTPERTWWRNHIPLLFRDDNGGNGAPAEPPPDPEKAALVPELELWLLEHEETHRELAPLARVLLGGALAHAGDIEAARAAWQSVLDRYPDSGQYHRAKYNLIEPHGFPSMPLNDTVGARRPSAIEAGIVVPDAQRREENLHRIRTDARYVAWRPELPFVRIEAGTFTMGGSPAVQARELPNRRVTISKPFYISAFPITRALWRVVHPDAYPGRESEGLAAELPAVQLSWLDITEFCAALSKLDGRTYRLPTEAEWEYAARGGLEGMQYPWGNEEADPTRLNYINLYPVPVACYAANGFGLFDCVGNCFEWCATTTPRTRTRARPPR